MSRSFERKVRKNMQQVNKNRKKSGQQTIQGGSASAGDKFYGRNVTVPIMLAGLAILYLSMTLFLTNRGMGTMDWVVFVLYTMLAVIFFLRRPYLRITKDTLYSFRSGREKFMAVKDIKSIQVQRGYVTVEKNGRWGNWVFSKTLARYDTDAITERLKAFAALHNIKFTEEHPKS